MSQYNYDEPEWDCDVPRHHVDVDGQMYFPFMGQPQAPEPPMTDREVQLRQRAALQDVPTDPVYQPAHYARYVIEPVTFINANKLPFNIGNVIKYALRYDAKDGVQDLRKAIRYLEIEIECINRRKLDGDQRLAWVQAL